MIILPKVVSYGGNAIRYATEKEKAEIVSMRYLPEDITPIAVWHRMQNHCLMNAGKHTHGRPMTNFMVSFVISPSAEESAGWTLEDYKRFNAEVLHEIDSVDISDQPKCKRCRPTHFENSMCISGLHHDSKSGIPHLHTDVCRLDNDGNTNDTHQILTRCKKAAENINRRHGWKQPEEIREERRSQISNDCLEILRGMQSYDPEVYFDALKKKGYKIKPRIDKSGILRGYTVTLGATEIKASELGFGRKLMASQLEDTWNSLHKQYMMPILPSHTAVSYKAPVISSDIIIEDEPKAPSQHSNMDSHKPNIPPPIKQQSSVVNIQMPSLVKLEIDVDGDIYECEIPEKVRDIIYNEVEVPDDADDSTEDDVANTAILLFCKMMDAATDCSSCCGGSGGTPSGWGRKKDDDDEIWARRCLKQAYKMHVPIVKRSRGIHR